MNETIGQRIQRLRKEKGLTQEQLASKITISPQAVSKWENDASYPDITLLIQLADILGITVDELLGKEKEEHPFLKKEEPIKAEVVDEDDDDDDDDDDEKEIRKHRRGDGSWIGLSILLFVALTVMMIMGLLWKEYNLGWCIGWTLILDALWLGSLIPALKKKKLGNFLYPFFILSIYMKLGYLGNAYGFEGFGFYWFLFITIPLYYIICGFVKSLVDRKKESKEEEK